MGLAAAEVGLKLDNRVAVIVGEALYAVDQEPPQAVGQKGAAEELYGILVLGDSAPHVDLPEVSRELSLLILSVGHVLMRAYHFPPWWKPPRSLVLCRRVAVRRLWARACSLKRSLSSSIFIVSTSPAWGEDTDDRSR